MTSTSREALDWIVRYVREHELSPGDALPNEIEVAEKLSIGRSSVREAFAVLRAFGVVRSKPGVGALLIGDYRRLDLMALFAHDHFELTDYRAFRQLRNFLELGSAEVILDRVRARDVRELRRLVDEIALGEDSSITPLEFEISFHGQLAQLTGNRFVVALSLLYRPMFEYHVSHRLPLEDQQVMPPEVVATHARIVDALEKRDQAALIEALRDEWTDNVMLDTRRLG